MFGHQIFKHAPEFVKKMMLNMKIDGDCNKIFTVIKGGYRVCVTDGSYNLFSEIATACWVIEGSDAQG